MTNLQSTPSDPSDTATPAPVLVTGTPALGYALCQWHASGGDPIYATGSSFIAGHGVPLEVARNAHRNLLEAARQEREAGRDKESREALLVAFKLRVYIRRAHPGWDDGD